MSRQINKDFAVLVEFFSQYQLSEKLKEPNFKAEIKKVHKRYLSALTFIFEVSHQRQQFVGPFPIQSQATYDYFKESISDIGNAFICFVHGAFKPAQIMLRSALETLAKGIAVADDIEVLKEKSVFNVIGNAKLSTFFQDPVSKLYFDRLETLYGELCKFVHTAENTHMAHISALSSLVQYDEAESLPVCDKICNVATIVLAIQVLFLKEEYHRMHFTNKELVRSCIPLDVRRKLAGQ